MSSAPAGERLALWSGRDLPPVVRRLGGASFFQDVASEMVYPLLPAFLAALGGGPVALGAMESAAEAVVALVKGWAGRASDRAGRRKPFVAFGYGASALARPLLAAAGAVWQVIALRLWDRLAKGVRTAPRDALLARAVAPGRRAYAFAFHRGLDHLGAALGPLVAAALVAGGAGFRWVFAVATIPALAGFVTVWLGLPRETAEPHPAPPVAAPEAATSSPRFRRALAAVFLFALANASDAFLLLRAGELGSPTAGLALGWAGLHAVRWLASAPGGRLADRIGPRRSLAAGWTLYALCYAGFALTGSLGALVALLVPYAAYAGLVEGAERALAVELGGGVSRSGTALGAWHRAAGLGGAVASLMFGGIWQAVGARAAFFAAATLALAAVVALPAVRAARSAPGGAAGDHRPA